MFNFNLCGRLTEDAKFFQINDRTNKIVFTVAVNHGNDDTSFIDCEFWQNLEYPKRGEAILNAYKKGLQVTVAGSAKKTKFLKNDVDDNGVERTKWVEKYEFKVEKFNLPDKKELGNVGNWGKKAENSYTKNNASPSSLPF